MTSPQSRAALVTGATGTIGSAIAAALAGKGHPVVLHYRSRGAEADKLAADLRARGARVATAAADLSQPDGPDQLVRAAETAVGPISILVHCAGGYIRKPLLETTPAEWDALMELDTRASFLLTRALAPGMIARRWGRIINLSAVSGQRYADGEGAYGAAKAAIDLLTRAWAVELAPHGVTVNAVAPALTVATGAALPTAKDFPQCAAVPDQRPGAAREVAALVSYLVSDDAAHVTGQVWQIDGGLAALLPKAH